MFYITKLTFSLLFILGSGILLAQDRPEFAVSLIDSSLTKNADAVIRFEETRYSIKSPREYTHQTSRVVSIFDEDSKESFIIIHYNKYSKAELISAVLYDAAGKFLRKIKKSEIIDETAYDGLSLLTDERYVGVRSFGGQLPYTIEYKWEITYRETMYYPEWDPQEEKESVEKAIFILDAPQDLLVHFRTLNYEFEYNNELKSDRLIQSWTILNREAIVKEDSGPPGYEIFPMVLLAPSIFQVGEFIGSMSDWKSFGTFLYELNKDREKMPEDMAALINQMTLNCTTPKEKIDTLYHWLQLNLRYVSVQLGIGGWQTFDAAYVEKNRYGDCKALSTFMKGLLREAGIISWEVSIKYAEEDNMFSDDFVYPDFNHVMLYVPHENIWLECTSNYFPTGQIDKDEQNKKVLLVTPEGGKISTTPFTPSERNQIYSTDTVILSDHFLISGREKYRGNMQNNIRGLYHYASQEEQRKYFLNQFPLSVQKLDQFQIFSDKTGEESILTYNAALSQFGSISGNRYFIPVNVIHPARHSCTSNVNRKTDFISKEDYTETNDIFISLPIDYIIEYLPPKSNFEFLGNHYSIEITIENQFLHVHHQMTESMMRITPEQYKELCSYYSSVAKTNSQMIVLKKSKA